MNTIHNYVESVFVNLPRTSEMKRLKENMLVNMEDKYQSLKDSGSSENEAIGTVLAEFGNINEIIEEYDLSLEENGFKENGDEIYLDDDEVENYLQHRHKYAFSIALGVFLCIIAVALFFTVIALFEYLLPSVPEDTKDILAITFLLSTIAIGVGLFIIFGIKESNYHFESRILQLEAKTYNRLKVEYADFKQRFAYAIAIGVVLCILAPISLLLSVALLGDNNPLSIVFLMGFVATGVFLFVYYGIQNDTYQKILTTGDHSRAHVKANKITDNVANIIFPIATLYYLYEGFFNRNWATAWIVFPMVGIVFAIFAAITEVWTNNREKK